ncbi:MAG TPA: heparinase II/III family protein, partial [Longimicrobium sp.]|nr:heparinase II/III family protein [Longimicrobium sp.]
MSVRLARKALGLLRLGPRTAAHLVRERVERRASAARERKRDEAHPTFGPPAAPALPRLLAPFDAAALPGSAPVLRMAALHLEHRFDLLGSGWVHVRHGMECRGVEGHVYPPGKTVDADAGGVWLTERVWPANLAEARRIWGLIDPGHVPLDWSVDFKSGYRWPEDARYDAISFGAAPGADVKVPWELGRLQHLPRLAWAYALARTGMPGALEAERYAREFRSQVLDFIAQNPPRQGVQWASPMDVAIRAANLVVAHDLFRAWGADFDAAFTAELARSVRAHARHVAAHLEWHPAVRGNHYLSNVAGLLFAAAFLQGGAESDAWLAFGVQELVGETSFQFLDEGANFEDSTAYHRLSAEMVMLGTALVLGLPDERKAALRSYDHRLIRRGPGLRRAPLPSYPTGPDGRETPFPPEHATRLRRM